MFWWFLPSNKQIHGTSHQPKLQQHSVSWQFLLRLSVLGGHKIGFQEYSREREWGELIDKNKWVENTPILLSDDFQKKMNFFLLRHALWQDKKNILFNCFWHLSFILWMTKHFWTLYGGSARLVLNFMDWKIKFLLTSKKYEENNKILAQQSMLTMSASNAVWILDNYC